MAGHNHFPWKHVIGFALSIILTLIALWVALYTSLSIKVILTIIVLLAVVQASIQLFMFMHVNETDSGNIQSGMMYFSAFVAFAIVAGSIWVMWF
ncbi:cytochrome aa3 quinol oxidase subunit IV [Bacillus tianshenii]|nr:cytochrome aa3 quinol oxidase subunit IV [Bacillus tianshenii]